MTVFVGILTFFVILAVLILGHELGHFTFAKLFGVRVEEFGLGFPPRIWGRRRGRTLYSLNLIPLGGFVKMLGENGEDAEPDSFGAKPPWQRFIILLAGPSVNLLLALGIFFFVFLGGSPRGLTVITKVLPHSPAATAGLRPGDQIVAIQGHSVKYLDQLQAIEARNLGHRVTLEFIRDYQPGQVSLIPRLRPPKNQGAIGIVLGKTAVVAYGPVKSVELAASQVANMAGSIPLLLQTVSKNGPTDVAGPIGIAHLTTGVVQQEPHQGPGSLLRLMALLSANLGVLNLLPIPALDGGRIVFVLVSWVRRRNTDPRVEGLVHMVGMAMLLLLILLISYNDIIRWVNGSSF